MNFMRHFGYLVAATLTLGTAQICAAQQVEVPADALTYADVADLADPAQLVVRAQVKKQIEVEPERAPGLAPGFVRLYIEAKTLALISGRVPIGESLRYLVDLPRDAKGKAPKLRKQEVLLFANPVAGRPGELRLVGPNAQLAYSPEREARIRPVLAELVATDAPPVVTGVSDALSVPGNLVGESETQIFLETADRSPVSITVLRRPGRDPVWGVSWGEIIDQAALPPQANTLAWYRLACALPARLPSNANLSREPASRAQAERDYSLVLGALGPCVRTLVRP
ncbi:hypothetical protein P7228_06955 [Altererythrobacter arenosus]|uniref:Uncharacterized protein n=1 Tax=Altererythrobacter arenosus TaxID=3032592 RepID=A0ABY8FUV8_9SPHN|nr:hypothetical protein [Altererythrobacter sp. CAU 1644]WFL78794.1 hypothetical protein P7228_06955 [Altererythrobacter sp. CAU 1644]